MFLYLIASLFIMFAVLYIAIISLYLLNKSSPPETECKIIPHNTVILAPAFSNLGKDTILNRYKPGAANRRIAERLEECGSTGREIEETTDRRFHLVLTQKAVSDALHNDNMLPDGTPVEQMHKDNETNVRTLEAISCALERLEDFPEATNFGLIVHDKHHERSRQALKAVLEAKFPKAIIVDIHLGPTPYEDDAFYRPWKWAIREAIVRPIQSFQILMSRMLGFKCSDEIKIPEKLSY